eukprot:804372-Rhodomonas_salina.1
MPQIQPTKSVCIDRLYMLSQQVLSAPSTKRKPRIHSSELGTGFDLRVADTIGITNGSVTPIFRLPEDAVERRCTITSRQGDDESCDEALLQTFLLCFSSKVTDRDQCEYKKNDRCQTAMEKYKIIRKLGEGAFGEVLLSQNVQSGETVALKKIFLRRSEDGIPVGVWREVKALQHAEHANVIKLQETFAHGSSLVLVMDCMACSLADVLRETDGQLEEGRAKAYALEILRGIAYVHSLGIIHRDLKPGNILLGENGAVKLADFGLARVVAQEGRENSYQVMAAFRSDVPFGGLKFPTTLGAMIPYLFLPAMCSHVHLDYRQPHGGTERPSSSFLRGVTELRS